MRNAINVKPVLLTLPGCHHFSIRIIALPSPLLAPHSVAAAATCHVPLAAAAATAAASWRRCEWQLKPGVSSRLSLFSAWLHLWNSFSASVLSPLDVTRYPLSLPPTTSPRLDSPPANQSNWLQSPLDATQHNCTRNESGKKTWNLHSTLLDDNEKAKHSRLKNALPVKFPSSLSIKLVKEAKEFERTDYDSFRVLIISSTLLRSKLLMNLSIFSVILVLQIITLNFSVHFCRNYLERSL